MVSVLWQPFRKEIDRIIQAYLVPGSARELNLSSIQRHTVLEALARTTHPSAFRPIFLSIEQTLRHSEHPRFINFSISNGNRARVIFAHGVGMLLWVNAMAGYLAVTFTTNNRLLRLIPAIGIFLGISTSYLALHGMCIILHGFHRRQVRPWECFADEEQGEAEHKGASALDDFKSFTQKLLFSNSAIADDQSKTVNEASASYETEPWVACYKNRNVFRKILDRELRIQDPDLKAAQNRLFFWSLFWGLVAAGITLAIFMPMGPQVG